MGDPNSKNAVLGLDCVIEFGCFDVKSIQRQPSRSIKTGHSKLKIKNIL